MASNVGRYTIVSPATSQILREVLDDAIDNGSRTVNLTVMDADNGDEEIEMVFVLTQIRYRAIDAEYLGQLRDQGTATITAMTHTDLGDTPARLTLVRRDTP